MATDSPFRTPYERRVKLVKDVVMSHSAIGDGDASEIAVDVLRALDRIPEKIR